MDKYLNYKENIYRGLPLCIRDQQRYIELRNDVLGYSGVISMKCDSVEKLLAKAERLGNNILLEKPYYNLFLKDKKVLPIWVYVIEYAEINYADILEEDINWYAADHYFNVERFYFNSFYNMIDFIYEKWGKCAKDFCYESDLSVPLN